MSAILRVRDENGNVIDIPAIVGPKGDPGKDFTYEDFTPEQLDALRGPQGIPGVAVQTAGYVTFNVTEDGILQCTYSGDEPPNYSINTDGHLILEM